MGYNKAIYVMRYYVESKNFEDLYLLPSRISQKAIVYSPLRGIAFMANKNIARLLYAGDSSFEDVEQITNKIKQIKINSDFPVEDQLSVSENLVFLLSNSCNLACEYCYAQYNRRDDILSLDKIKLMIDHVFSLHVNDEKELDISFLGGGEPTYHWKLLALAILYAREKSALLNLNVRIGFPTNGTLLNEERIRFLAENNVQVGMSFDILPEIQNEQRQTSEPFVLPGQERIGSRCNCRLGKPDCDRDKKLKYTRIKAFFKFKAIS